jgi:hypothetical protein
MAMPTCTTKSAAPVKLHSPAAQEASPDPVLELPVDPDFLPLLLPASPEPALEISASYLPRLLARPEFWKDRSEERCLVEFDLQHPERFPATYPAALLRELFWGT